MSDALCKLIQEHRTAMLNPPSDEYVVDSCAAHLPFFESILRHPEADSENIAAALESIGTAMGVAEVYPLESTRRRAWEFYSAAAAVASCKWLWIECAIAELWDDEVTMKKLEIDRPTKYLILGMSRPIVLANYKVSEYFRNRILPFIQSNIDQNL